MIWVAEVRLSIYSKAHAQPEKEVALNTKISG